MAGRSPGGETPGAHVHEGGGLRGRLGLHPGRVFTAPRVASIAVRPASEDAARDCTVQIDGMVCATCAARTRAALAEVEGIEHCEVDLESGEAHLRVRAGSEPNLERLQRALDRVVVGGRARRWIARRAKALPGRGGGGKG